jgi:uncharacterized 2Fe-2S/4Fe-4S cluster protein (DUF4445 family)
MGTQQAEYTVTFLPSGKKVHVKAKTPVLEAARKAGLHINASCGGAGVCGQCRILVEQGTVHGESQGRLSAQDRAAGFHQACLALVHEALTVRLPGNSGEEQGGLSTEIPARHRARMHIFDMEGLRKEGIFYPPVEKLCIQLPPPTVHDNRADGTRLLQALADQYQRHCSAVTLPVLRKLRKALRQEDFLVTATLEVPVEQEGESKVLNIQPGSWCHRNFALAFDIGTTTVYGILFDLNTGKVLARASCYNPQMSYGEDVISRIIQAEKSGGLALMQRLITEAMNSCIEQMLATVHPSDGQGMHLEEINSITIAANTTMTHLLLELEPDNIRRSPYVPVANFFPSIRAKDLGLHLKEHCTAFIYPSISSYVGGDIVAGIMGSGMYRTDLLTLFIDVGTNAEIVIGHKDWLACAACSAGPAFEGGGITHGMRAVEGAISDFSINPETLEPMNVTEGRKAPLGICGSGLLVMVASLFEHGLLNPDGTLNRLDHPRLRPGRSGWEYVVAWQHESGTQHDIVLNEVDIQNFIRAKAAIFAGITTVLEEVGLRVEEIEQIILAGGFGSFIDLDSAMSVGLLPELDPNKILYVGNGSLMGAWMNGLSNHIRKDMTSAVRRMTNFELSELPNFTAQYMASMFLPHTDSSLFPQAQKKRASQKKLNN